VVDEMEKGEAVKVILGDEATKKDILDWSKKNLTVVEDKQEETSTS
jgi:TusA-related sulfurtransferase